jgi:type IV secretory pathway VirB10-like protein
MADEVYSNCGAGLDVKAAANAETAETRALQDQSAAGTAEEMQDAAAVMEEEAKVQEEAAMAQLKAEQEISAKRKVEAEAVMRKKEMATRKQAEAAAKTAEQTRLNQNAAKKNEEQQNKEDEEKAAAAEAEKKRVFYVYRISCDVSVFTVSRTNAIHRVCDAATHKRLLATQHSTIHASLHLGSLSTRTI